MPTSLMKMWLRLPSALILRALTVCSLSFGYVDALRYLALCNIQILQTVTLLPTPYAFQLVRITGYSLVRGSPLALPHHSSTIILLPSAAV